MASAGHAALLCHYFADKDALVLEVIRRQLDYQRQGFRVRSVERDVFTEASGYPGGIQIDGIPLRDRVWLDIRLGSALSSA